MEGSSSKKQDQKNIRLQILLIGEVFRSLSSFLHTTDALNFLSCHPDSYNLKSPWVTMYYNLKLTTAIGTNLPSGVSCKVPRSLVIHSICDLGYNCVRCCIPLTGPAGFFACTNLCTNCSLNAFKETGSRIYVDGSIRFYLSGEKSIITKGRAFLTHPFWISDDDKYYTRFFNEHGGDPYQLAEEIYTEKKFFTEFCTAEMGIPRPRDDKAATIRKMLELSSGHDSDSEIDIPWDVKERLSEGEDLSSGDEGTYQNLTDSESERASDEAVTSDTTCLISDSVSSDGPNGSKKQPDWVKNLPGTLKGMYEDQKKQKVKQQQTPPCLGTSPLREVVVQMHKREGAIIKYLY